VAPPTALASLLPAGSTLQAQLYAPSRHIGQVRSGQAVRLRLEAWPHAKYGALAGRVLAVAHVPLAATELASLPLPGALPMGEPLYRITVALDPLPSAWADRPLATGLRLQADVLLERRRLIEWLFEPLLGLQQRL
jgi:membrane fusion protein